MSEEVETDVHRLSRLILKGLFVSSGPDTGVNLMKICEEMGLDEEQLNKLLNLIQNLTQFCYSVTDKEIPD